jgi:hypothetical protein
VSCVVSIGTGEVGAKAYAQPKGFAKVLPITLINVLKDISTNCGVKAESYEKRFAASPGLYFRFNVNVGLEDVSLDEWNRLGLVRAATQNYMLLSRVDGQLDSVVRALTRGLQPNAPMYTLSELGN